MSKQKILYNWMWIAGILAPAYILHIGGTSIVVYISLISLCFLFVLGRRVGHLSINTSQIDKLYVGIVLSSVFSLVNAILFMSTDQWKWQAVVFWIYNFIIFCFYFFASTIKKNIYAGFGLGVKVSVTIQIFYGYVQYFAYKLFEFDINDFIFNQTLHITEKASHYNYTELVPTGLGWHPGTYAPILALGYCYCINNPIMKLAIIGVTFLTQSSTCILGVTTCVVLEIIMKLGKKKKIKFSLQKLIIVLIAAVAIILVAVQMDFVSIVSNEITRLIKRVTSTNTLSGDASTYYHLRYLTGIPEVASTANFLQLFFGIGDGCSGYAFVKAFGQYVSHDPWDIECQISADLINRGLIGFIFTYLWTFRLLKISYERDKKGFIFIAAIFVMSFTYNIRFMYVQLFEIILYLALKREESIWGE